MCGGGGRWRLSRGYGGFGWLSPAVVVREMLPKLVAWWVSEEAGEGVDGGGVGEDNAGDRRVDDGGILWRLVGR
ncbi:hypothetical protein Tco_1264761 [Tanacetum coccineum]